MYGTIAKYRIKTGREDELLAEMKRFEESPPEGWAYTTIFRSVSDPAEIWLSVVFESEEAYKRNADSPEMAGGYRRVRENLEADPEWHDGHVIHEAMRKRAPA